MKLIIPENNYNLVEFYDAVATEMGYADTGELRYDCRKINIAKNIQDGFYKHYTDEIKELTPNASMNEIRSGISMLLLVSGPKVDSDLKANEVEVFDGFIC